MDIVGGAWLVVPWPVVPGRRPVVRRPVVPAGDAWPVVPGTNLINLTPEAPAAPGADLIDLTLGRARIHVSGAAQGLEGGRLTWPRAEGLMSNLLNNWMISRLGPQSFSSSILCAMKSISLIWPTNSLCSPSRFSTRSLPPETGLILMTSFRNRSCLPLVTIYAVDSHMAFLRKNNNKAQRREGPRSIYLESPF